MKSFTLASGRRIRLFALHQRAVYAGLIEGLPTRQMNRGTIESLLDEARERTGHEPLLIEPTETPIEYNGRYPFGDPASLPAISCVADFVSSGNDPLYYTRLSVFWFQEDYAFPLSADVDAALATLDWDRVALEEEV